MFAWQIISFPVDEFSNINIELLIFNIANSFLLEKGQEL